MLARINALLPKFFYFDEYSSLPGTIKIAELLQKKRHDLSEEETTARSPLDLAGAEKDYLLNVDYEVRKRELENVANSLTNDVLDYWSTNPELRVHIDIVQKTVQMQPPQQGSMPFWTNLRFVCGMTAIYCRYPSTSGPPAFDFSFLSWLHSRITNRETTRSLSSWMSRGLVFTPAHSMISCGSSS